MPRHPPCALNNLTNTHIKKSRHKCAQKQKMLASTVQFSTTTRTATRQPPSRGSKVNDRPSRQQTSPHKGARLSSQDPTVCCPTTPLTKGAGRVSGDSTFLEQPPPTPRDTVRRPRVRRLELGEVLRPSTTSPDGHRTFACGHAGRRCSVKLLRKEVIQPHLPVRLPCYDFVPIASPTFDRSPPDGLGHGLRVLPTFVT
jgi:hypothetical protein